MTILTHVHPSHYRHFKASYSEHVLKHPHSEVPGLVTYTRFVVPIPSVLAPLCVYLRMACLGTCTGISFIGSTALAICKTLRTHCQKVFARLTERGKTATGWFFGFKRHPMFNDHSELLNLLLTPGHVDDRTSVPNLAHQRFGRSVDAKGYLSTAL